MVRRLLIAATAGAVALAGLAVAGAGTASAVTVITAGPGSHVTCSTLKAKASLTPALKDNWVKADHASDPDPVFAAIPDTSFASNGPVTVDSKTKATGCTGTVVQGANSAIVKKATLYLKTNPAHPGLPNPATCEALVNPGDPQPTDANYVVDVQWKSGTKGFTIADSHAVGVTLQNSGLGFAVGGGTITGSFAGGTSLTQANVDGKTLSAFLTASFYTHLTSTNYKTTAYKPCQAKLKGKNKKGVQTWSLKPPKGLNKIKIASGSVEFTG
jgi:hypothetical protein